MGEPAERGVWKPWSPGTHARATLEPQTSKSGQLLPAVGILVNLTVAVSSGETHRSSDTDHNVSCSQQLPAQRAYFVLEMQDVRIRFLSSPGFLVHRKRQKFWILEIWN